MKRRELIAHAVQITAEAEAAARRAAAAAEALEGPIGPGDLLVLPTRAPVIHWLVVQSHPEDSRLLFAVPADDQPEAGAADLRAAALPPWGAWVLRCGHGLWLEADLLGEARRVGRFSEQALHVVRALLGKLVAGTLKAPFDRQSLDDDPDYLAWLEDVEASREQTLDWLSRVGVVLRWAEMSPETPAQLVRAGLPAELAGAPPARLAAAGGGLGKRLAARLQEASVSRWGSLSPDGDLHVAVALAGAIFISTRKGGRRPKLAEWDGAAFRPVAWKSLPEMAVTAEIPWREERILVRIGDGRGRLLVVRK